MPVSRNRCIFLNVGLGEGSALPVGVPVPWPSATPPTGWLKCNGAPFSAEEYPELAKVYPTNELPDLRGEFIRGWDDGRGVDTGRGILSAQGDAIRNITGWFGAHATVVAKPPFVKFSAPEKAENVGVGGGSTQNAVKLDLSLSVPTASENRPRSIAFNYIVRAA
ncbi:phage tail protein [Escherichia coli]